jgi:hypothetical protein
MDNYDTIIRVIGETDPRRAPIVASQACRSDNPLRWAKRSLAELQAAGWLELDTTCRCVVYVVDFGTAGNGLSWARLGVRVTCQSDCCGFYFVSKNGDISISL